MSERPPTVNGAAGGVAEHDPVRIHEPIYRELAEPRDGHEPTPMWLVFFVMALLGWGGYYLGIYSGGFRADVYTEQIGHAKAQAEPAPTAPEDPMVLGRRVFNNCMSCHQKDGAGVPGAYPPLAGSEWVAGEPAVLAGIVLHGLEGGITVAGAQFDNAMPAWDRLSDEEIAAVLTYVRASFGNASPPVDPATVAAVRSATSDRTRAWKVAELDTLRGLAAPVPATEAQTAGQ